MNAPTLNGAEGGNVTLGHNMFCITETIFTNRERLAQSKSREYSFYYIRLSTRTESETLACLTILGLRYIV